MAQSNIAVISAFRDRNTGKLVQPGSPLPKGLDDDTIRRLTRAGCLAVDTRRKAAPAPKAAKPKAETKAKPKTTQPKSAKGSDASFRGGAGAEAVAGGDGGNSGGGSEPAASGRRTNAPDAD